MKKITTSAIFIIGIIMNVHSQKIVNSYTYNTNGLLIKSIKNIEFDGSKIWISGTNTANTVDLKGQAGIQVFDKVSTWTKYDKNTVFFKDGFTTGTSNNMYLNYVNGSMYTNIKYSSPSTGGSVINKIAKYTNGTWEILSTPTGNTFYKSMIGIKDSIYIISDGSNVYNYNSTSNTFSSGVINYLKIGTLLPLKFNMACVSGNETNYYDRDFSKQQVSPVFTSTNEVSSNGCKPAIGTDGSYYFSNMNNIYKVTQILKNRVEKTGMGFTPTNTKIGAIKFDSKNNMYFYYQSLDSIGVGTMINGKLVTKMVEVKPTTTNYEMMNNIVIDEKDHVWMASSTTVYEMDFSSTLTGINEEELDNSIAVYPNPSVGIFKVISDNNINTVSIINSIGGVETHQVNEMSSDINTAFKGIVVVHIRSNKGISTQKMLIQ